MSRKTAIYKAIEREYEQVRSHNAYRLRQRKEEVYNRVPRIKAIEEEMSLLGIRVGRLVLSEPERAEEMSEKLKQDMLGLKHEKKSLLEVYGFKEDTLMLEYNCNKCKDTGYIGSKHCICMKQKLMDAAYDQSNVRKIIEIENFDTFDLSYYSDQYDESLGDSPKKYMWDINQTCMKFARNFATEYSNILLYGSTGLGKTFLCNCIAKDVLDNGHTVLYMTAGQLFKHIEDQRFNRNEDEEKEDYIADILETDLFIIDDLGTEFTTILSTSEFFHIINTRLLQRKPVVISTNLSPKDLIDHYSDRIASRIFGEYEVLKLFGDDLRTKKKFGNRPPLG